MEQKKMRIQKFDSEWRLLEDKTYKESYELSSGPKETHDGPIRIEFTLEDSEDIDKCIIYLQKLKGKIPLESKVKKEKPKKAKDIDDIQELYQRVLEQPDQDSLIKFLRECGFIFVTRDLLASMEVFEKVDFIDPVDTDKYQYMVKLIKESKNNPMLDRYDPRLLVGIKIYGKRRDTVNIYLNGEYMPKVEFTVPKSSTEVFENQKLFIFPEYMEEKEKEKFRKEYRKMEITPELQPSEFFKRWIKWTKVSKVLDNFKDLV